MVGDRRTEGRRPAGTGRWRRCGCRLDRLDCEALVRAVGTTELGKCRWVVGITRPLGAEAVASRCERASGGVYFGRRCARTAAGADKHSRPDVGTAAGARTAGDGPAQEEGHRAARCITDLVA